MSCEVHAGFCERRGVRLPPATHPIVHCTTLRQAEHVLARITARMSEVGLRLHPTKTRIVYCKDDNRRGQHEHTAFTFLGYAFRPGERSAARPAKPFVAFLPAISPQALKAKSDRLREMRIHRRTDLTLDDLAGWLNPIVGGWIDYYGRYYRSALFPLLRRVNYYLRRWAGKKYDGSGPTSFEGWWNGLHKRQPDLFVHWRWVRAY